MRSEDPVWPGNTDVITANSSPASAPAHDTPPGLAQIARNFGYVVITENLPADLPVSDAELTCRRRRRRGDG